MKKVLIVEDQRMPRENMERILLDSGKYALSASVNGADVALAVCRREQIDLILMDVCKSLQEEVLCFCLPLSKHSTLDIDMNI